MLAKNMTQERIDIQVDKQHLRVVIRDAEGEQEYELDLDLYDEVSCLHLVSKAVSRTVKQPVVISSQLVEPRVLTSPPIHVLTAC